MPKRRRRKPPPLFSFREKTHLGRRSHRQVTKVLLTPDRSTVPFPCSGTMKHARRSHDRSGGGASKGWRGACGTPLSFPFRVFFFDRRFSCVRYGKRGNDEPPPTKARNAKHKKIFYFIGLYCSLKWPLARHLPDHQKCRRRGELFSPAPFSLFRSAAATWFGDRGKVGQFEAATQQQLLPPR